MVYGYRTGLYALRHCARLRADETLLVAGATAAGIRHLDDHAPQRQRRRATGHLILPEGRRTSRPKQCRLLNTAPVSQDTIY